ncbi:MAG: NHL repeat-containing protein [Candidatus Eisenbacteria bacterium]|nr:NHL repeat-containing protein [Candidatus Eisenbacteria bacterium]
MSRLRNLSRWMQFAPKVSASRAACLALLVLIAGVIAGCGQARVGVQLVYAFFQSFSARGTQPDSLQAPDALLVLGDGVFIREVWVAERDSNRVSRFRFEGTYRGSFGAPGQFDRPVALAPANDSTVFVLDQGGHVSVVDTSGATRRYFLLPSGRTFEALASRGNEVFVGSMRPGVPGQAFVDVFDAEGELLRTIGAQPGDSLSSVAPCGIAVHDTLLYVSDWWAGKVVVFHVSGRRLRSFGRTGTGAGEWERASPGALAFTDDGRLLVSDRENHRVQEYNPDGTYVTQFGRTEVGGAASFQVASIATYSSSLLGEYIYCADEAANRVSIVIRRYIASESRPGVLTRPRGPAGR